MSEQILRKKIYNILKENFLHKEEENELEINQTSFDKEVAINIVFNFINNNMDDKSVEVNDSYEMEISDMVEDNDYFKKGFAFKTETPTISFKINGEVFHITVNIKKEYYYETESETFTDPSHASAELKKVTIEDNFVYVYNNNGQEVILKKMDIGSQNFKKLEDKILEFIK